MKPGDREGEIVLFDSRDHHLQTQDSPTAAGRVPAPGDQLWTFRWTLDDGTTLFLDMGRESHDAFRGFLLREELDDVADRAAESL